VDGRRFADRLVILDALRTTVGVGWSAAVVVECSDRMLDADDLSATDVLPTASVGKLLLLATVLDEIEQGRLDASEQLTATAADAVADSGLLQHLDEQNASVIDLCRFVAAVSDNLATNVLIRQVGLDAVAATTARLGLRTCALHDTVRNVRGPEHPPYLSSGSAAELVVFVRSARSGELVSPGVSSNIVELMRLNTDVSMVAAAFALDPLAHTGEDLGIRLFNKTGTQVGTRADIGCVESTVGERLTASYAVIARFDDGREIRRAVLGAMRSVGEAIGEALGAHP
jgi:beta-lactamase class A